VADTYRRTLKRAYPRILATILVACVAFGCSSERKKIGFLKRADRYFESGEFDKAKIEYLNLLKADPRNPTAIRQLGVIWYEQGAALNATPFLLAARDLIPEDLEVRMKLAFIELAVGQFADARKEALAVLDRSPTHNQAMPLLVEASRSQREVDEAEQRLRSLKAGDKAGFHLALAALFLRKRDMPSAESEVKHALSIDPNSIEAHLALAKISWLRNDLVKADEEFKTAAELAPLRSAAPLLYAEFQARTRAVDKAKTRLDKITREAPDFLPAWRLLAQIAFTEGRFNDSLTLLENIALRDPANIEARLLQAQVWLAKGDLKKALETLGNLDARFPRFPPIKYQLARAHLKDHDTSQAVAMLNQAIMINPDFVEAILLLGEINLHTGDPKQVLASMLSLLKKRPDLIEAQLLLAQAYQLLGQLDDAAAVFREQIKVSPHNAQAHFLLGLFLLRQNKIEEARRSIETAQQLAPESLLPVAQLVDLDIQNKDFDAAFRQVRNQLQKTPESSGAYLLEGKIYAVQAKWDEAEAALRKSLELDPNSSSAYDLLISTYLAANRLPQAIAALEDLLSKRSDNVRALMVLAQTYERMNDFPKARDAYERLLKVNPDSPFALNNLAYLYSERLGQLDKAYNLAQKARGLLPAEPIIADTLGWILYKKGDYQKALTSLQESAMRLPHNSEIQFHLGMASYMMNDRDAARTAFHKALSAANDFPGKEEVQRRLALLDLAEGKATGPSSEELQMMLRQQPDDLVTRMLLGESYEKQGAFAEAAATYEEATKLNPKLLSATIKLAELNAGPLRDSGKALEFARKARELAPNDPKVLGILGAAAYQTDNFNWAYSLLQESASRLPNNLEVLHDFAWAAYSMGRVSEARDAMQRLLASSPNSPQQSDAGLFLRMTALDHDGAELAAAEAEVEKAINANPNNVPALVAKARRLRQGGESIAAAAIYSDVLRRFPDFAPAQKHLASLYVETSDKRAEAYELAVRARRALPDDLELAQILAELSYDRQDFAYAVQLLRQCSEKRPLGAKDLYYLGMSHLKTNEKPKSRKALDQALAAGLQDPLASDAKRALSEMEKN
jgi:tetratricopeptide (TPR) repeat protein